MKKHRFAKLVAREVIKMIKKRNKKKSIEMAKAEGWMSKPRSKWKTMPRREAR